MAGVTYQMAVTAHLLIAGGTGSLPITSVTPEGDEDVDCGLEQGQRLLVQAKERGGGEGRLQRSDLALIVARQANLLKADPALRLAVVTDADLGEGLVETGWGQTLGATLRTNDCEVLASQVQGLGGREARDLLEAVHVVRLPWELQRLSVEALAESIGQPSAVAELVHARLLQDLSTVSSDQRTRSRQEAIRRTVNDLKALTRRVLETVNLDSLEEAVREGVVETVDFTRPLDLSPERFLAGVDVRPGHIAAGLDLPRPQELEEVYSGLNENRYVLILGPSGAGKSALLWRAAREIRGRVRVARLLSLENQADLTRFFRWVELQAPSLEVPLLLCLDDVGQLPLNQWPRAVKRLLEVPGVIIAGAVRQEDFQPELSAGSPRLVQPRLDRTLAFSIAETLEMRGVQTRLDRVEAYEKADSLLMEFLSLLVTGRRLEEVVSTQVDARLSPARKTEREALRLVCAAHRMGLSVAAERLSLMLGEPGDLVQSLRCLNQEHLITTDQHEGWRGLHELRSEVIHRRIHALPPPTEVETYVTLLSHLDIDGQSRLVRTLAQRTDLDLEPLAQRIGDWLVAECQALRDAAELLEALSQADATRFAKHIVRVVEEAGDRSVDFEGQAWLAYARQAGIFSLSEEMVLRFSTIDRLVEALPKRKDTLREIAVAALDKEWIEGIVIHGPIEDVARLLDVAGEKVVKVLAKSTITRVMKGCADVPAAERGRLLGSVARVWRHAISLEEIAGSVEARLLGFAREHVNGLSVSMTENPEEGLIATVSLLAPVMLDHAHDQAVAAARVMFDLCPELAVAEVVTLLPDGSRWRMGDHEPGYKKIPRANLPSAVETRRHGAVLDAIRALLVARSLTERLWEQAAISELLGTLFDEAAIRLLHHHDNEGRRRTWKEACGAAAERMNRMLYLPLTEVARDTADLAREALSTWTMALSQLASELEDLKKHRKYGIGSQLRKGMQKYEEAREEDMIRLASVGDPLPVALHGKVARIADLLYALADNPEGEWRVRRRPDEAWTEVAGRVIQEAREAILEAERRTLTSALLEEEDDWSEGSILVYSAKHLDREKVQLVTDRWVIVLPVGCSERLPRLLDLPREMSQRLAFRTFVLLELDGKVLVGVQLGSRQLRPAFYQIVPELLAELTVEVGLTLARSPTQERIDRVGMLLMETSRALGFARLRSSDLGSPPSKQAVGTLWSEARAIAQTVEEPELRNSLQQIVEEVATEEKVNGGRFAAEQLRIVVGAGTPGEGPNKLAELQLVAAALGL